MQVKVKIVLEELRKRKIFVATPMYGGQCAGMFTNSCLELSKLAAANGVDVRYRFLFNESLITRARNYLADEFMRSDCTHLMFIDADICFQAADVMALAAIADPASDKDVVCGPYPKKAVAWDKIKAAVEKGFAAQDSNALERFTGDFVFNPKSSDAFRIDQVLEVLESGTGFMMIQRSALERFGKAYPEARYLPDHVGTADFDSSREIAMYFQAEIDPKSKRYLSEDYWFCQKAQGAGIKVWLCPWMNNIHIGNFLFKGSMLDTAQLGTASQ